MSETTTSEDFLVYQVLPSNADVVLDEMKKILRQKLVQTPEQDLALELLLAIEKGYKRETKSE